MNRIRLLPEHVANQIAAGEVVERPASVVKELVENAVDAKSTRITVEIQAGGRSLIRVTDDGTGMNRDDALLCLERHATSKIERAEDLASITTMGFRGEALPSIASISRFTLTTRQRDDASPEGTQVIVNGGKIIEVKAAGCAPGTVLEVRQIFFNLPARRKFLRAEETESSHIQHYLTLAALAHPEVAFTFLKDGRVIWQLPGAKIENDEARPGPLHERLRALIGGDVKLLQVEYSAELPALKHADSEDETRSSRLKIWGFIGAPGVSRSTREDQFAFVNRRPVENRGINFALLEGYHTALMKGRFPVCCLFLEMDPGEVDVNIHPSKREVKFHRERAVREAVAQSVRKTLLEFHAAADKARQQFTAPLPEPRPISEKNKPIAPPVLELTRPQAIAPEPEPIELPNFPKLSKPIANWPAATIESPPARLDSLSPTIPSTLPVAHFASRSPAEPVPLLNVPLRIIGVIGRLYVVLESDRGLVLLDQHAAHERILFEQMLRRMEENETAASQRLLLPETVELSPRDAQFLSQNLSTLTRLGVGLSEFGERTFLLDALPPFVKVSGPRKFVLELIDELKAAGSSVNTLRLGEHTIAKTVCRHAVKANDPLAGPELENLVNDLRHCAMPYTCPHGRPTLIEMNYRELEKKFGRMQ
ncbi:MAG: DNA mismatch repair endonuclease MutL [Verrucomicrobia bacterium]|nr:DNA mismatch repair endonuclease MutL [Verrucomicrobiota bacterium]